MGRARIDVLIVTALKEELDAVLGLELGEGSTGGWKRLLDRNELPYHVRELRNDRGETLHVAAAWAGSMGESSIAIRAVGLVAEFDPACLAMCGICAGRRGKVFLGDVIVAERAFSYDHGKLVAAPEEQGGGFFHDIATYNLELAWRMEAEYFLKEFRGSWKPALPRPLSKESQERWVLLTLHAHEQGTGESPHKHPDRQTWCPDWAERVRALRERGLLEATPGALRLTEAGRTWAADALLLDPDGQERDPDFRVHVAPMATGKTVREDPELFKRLASFERSVLGAEMEAAAIAQVASQFKRKSLIAKAVSDYGDRDKDDAFRAFACHASAAFLLAFLRKHVRARKPGIQSVRGASAPVPAGEEAAQPAELVRKQRRNEFLSRVERACKLREPAGTQFVRLQSGPPFSTFLEVTVLDGNVARVYPLAAFSHPITREAVEAFLRDIHTPSEWDNPGVVSTLVHAGKVTPAELVQFAVARRVNLLSFEEYHGLIDFSEYLRRQSARLEVDPIYPPSSYVEQRGQVSVAGQAHGLTDNVLNTLSELLDSPEQRFALVLGEFGTGKTFLLHELARRLGGQGSGGLIPVLIDLRALQKQRSLRELIAQHFASAEVPRFEVEKFLYMLREGRIVLLFDGFDELALRVTYDQVIAHFGTLLEAAEGRAKVVITSRTQHFLTDQDIKRELAQRAEALPGYRLIKLERFTQEQIRRFLVKRLGDEAAAAKRMELLRDVRDLLGLAENPRLLSFIVELEAEKLEAAREGSGEITSAKLYELLIQRWLSGEYTRVNPPGAPKGLSVEQMRQGATALALLLWERTERTVRMDELPESLLKAVSAQGEHVIDTEKVKHQLGSGSLLVRDEEGHFTFVHQSVMEWLVADEAARQVRAQEGAAALGQREMSELMADFFIALAGHEAARAWAEWKSSSADNEVATRNALRVLGRLRRAAPGQSAGVDQAPAKNLEGRDLRGQNLVEADLRHANLRRANLSGAFLLMAKLQGAQLEEASLVGAALVLADLEGADLTRADFTRADLWGADLRGAKLRGTKLRLARLGDAQVDSLEGCDVFGAALPDQLSPEPQLAPGAGSLAVAFSPGDGLLATGHEDGTVRLWDVASATVLRVLVGHWDHVLGLAFSPDGTLLASASEDRSVRLWSVTDGKPLQVLREAAKKSARRVAFSPDGTLLASTSEDEHVRLWSVPEGQLLSILEGHQGEVFGLAFSPDGALLASASDDTTVRLWSVATRGLMRVLKGMDGPVTDVVFGLDGKTLYGSSSVEAIKAWSLTEEQEPRVFTSHSGSILRLVLSPDGKLLASAANDATVGLWSVAEGRMIHVLEGHDDIVLDVAFSPDGATLASVSEDGSMGLWSVPEGHALQVLEPRHEKVALGVAFSPDGATLACSSNDGVLALWDMRTGHLLRVHEGFSALSRGMTFSLDGSRLAGLMADKTIRIWRVADGEVLRILSGRGLESTQSMVLSPDGRFFAAASDDRIISVWSVDTGEHLAWLTGHWGAIHSMAFSPDGELLSAASRDQSIQLWRWKAGHTPIRVGSGYFSRVAFSPDGASLAAGTQGDTIQLWSVADGQPGKVLKHPEGPIHQVRFSPRGGILASISGPDSSVRIWDVNDGRVLSTLRGHRGAAQSVAFNPDGRTLAVAYGDGVVGLHELSTGDCLCRFLRLSEGWVVLRGDGRYKLSGETASAFWFAVGLCRFESYDATSTFPGSLCMEDDEPLFG